MKNLYPLLWVLVILVFVGLGIWWEVEMWSECRMTNSFWYCMRVLGK